MRNRRTEENDPLEVAEQLAEMAMHAQASKCALHVSFGILNSLRGIVRNKNGWGTAGFGIPLSTMYLSLKCYRTSSLREESSRSKVRVTKENYTVPRHRCRESQK